MKHDWSIKRMGGTTCSKCNKVRMPHNIDSECNERPPIFERMTTEEIEESLERSEETEN